MAREGEGKGREKGREEVGIFFTTTLRAKLHPSSQIHWMQIDNKK